MVRVKVLRLMIHHDDRKSTLSLVRRVDVDIVEISVFLELSDGGEVPKASKL